MVIISPYKPLVRNNNNNNRNHKFHLISKKNLSETYLAIVLTLETLSLYKHLCQEQQSLAGYSRIVARP